MTEILEVICVLFTCLFLFATGYIAIAFIVAAFAENSIDVFKKGIKFLRR